MRTSASVRGFTLLETLVATGILITALAGVAQLFVLASHLTRQASTSGAALLAAQDKLEALRAAAFEFDATGTAVTDTALQPSPSTSLSEDIRPYVDWLDDAGGPLEQADGAALIRRWRISQAAFLPPETIAIEVCVFARDVTDRGPQSADACLSTLRTRQP
jgi:type II secretory pathway pseudopilin PulG